MANERTIEMNNLTPHGDQRIYMENELDDKYKKVTTKGTKNGIINRIRRKCECSVGRIKCLFLSIFPIICWLPRYDIKQNLVSDITAGLTVGVVQIPQGMAYALLATLPPIVGMYVSFFPVLIYPLIGTSRHLSIGTFAVVSILISGVLDQRVPESYCGDDEGAITASTLTQSEVSSLMNSTLNAYSAMATDSTFSCKEIYEARKVQFAVALSFSVGLLQILMYFFKLGLVTVFLSESLLSGFVCGASFHVVTSQIPKLFGIAVPRRSGPLALIYTYIDIVKNISDIKWGTTILSLICTVLLIVGKEINARLRKKFPLPIPWELIIVVFTTIASYYGHFEEKYSVVVVGEIPTGIVTSVPRWSDVTVAIMDSLPLAIVAFTVEISLCQLFATKHAYKIDSNQELLALGACNMFGAFFSCFPSACSLSRSVIYEEMGGRTQLGGYMSAVVVMSVLLWIGPLFESLPQASLAVIIIVNIKRLVFMWRNVKPLWAINRLDAVVWIVAWCCVIVLGVGMGLLIGTSFSILTVLLRTRSAKGTEIRQVAHSDAYRNVDKYDTLPLRERIFVFRFTGPLYFANKDRFSRDLISRLGFDPVAKSASKVVTDVEEGKTKAKSNKTDELNFIPEANGKGSPAPEEDDFGANQRSLGDDGGDSDINLTTTSPHSTRSEDDISTRFSHVVFDMGQCSFMDSDGGKLIRAVHDSLDQLGVRLMLASCNADVRRTLKVLWNDREASEYISLQSAVDRAKAEIHNKTARKFTVTESVGNEDE